MNACAPPDPHMHIFLLLLHAQIMKTFVFTQISLFVQIATHSFNFEFRTRKLKVMDKTFLQRVSSSFIIVLARVNNFDTVFIP